MPKFDTTWFEGPGVAHKADKDPLPTAVLPIHHVSKKPMRASGAWADRDCFLVPIVLAPLTSFMHVTTPTGEIVTKYPPYMLSPTRLRAVGTCTLPGHLYLQPLELAQDSNKWVQLTQAKKIYVDTNNGSLPIQPFMYVNSREGESDWVDIASYMPPDVLRAYHYNLSSAHRADVKMTRREGQVVALVSADSALKDYACFILNIKKADRPSTGDVVLTEGQLEEMKALMNADYKALKAYNGALAVAFIGATPHHPTDCLPELHLTIEFDFQHTGSHRFKETVEFDSRTGRFAIKPHAPHADAHCVQRQPWSQTVTGGILANVSPAVITLSNEPEQPAAPEEPRTVPLNAFDDDDDEELTNIRKAQSAAKEDDDDENGSDASDYEN